MANPPYGLPALRSLLPLIDSFKFYEPLRRNQTLFSSAHVIEDGHAIAWGEDENIDMPATSIVRLAEEAMSADDFSAFLERNRLTHQGAASALGRSRRHIEYYLSTGAIPRIIALACFGYTPNSYLVPDCPVRVIVLSLAIGASFHACVFQFGSRKRLNTRPLMQRVGLLERVFGYSVRE